MNNMKEKDKQAKKKMLHLFKKKKISCKLFKYLLNFLSNLEKEEEKKKRIYVFFF